MVARSHSRHMQSHHRCSSSCCRRPSLARGSSQPVLERESLVAGALAAHSRGSFHTLAAHCLAARYRAAAVRCLAASNRAAWRLVARERPGQRLRQKEKRLGVCVSWAVCADGQLLFYNAMSQLTRRPISHASARLYLRVLDLHGFVEGIARQLWCLPLETQNWHLELL